MSTGPRYLFRYRNLLAADTLGAHRDLIDEHGSCWWGWWQRPAEDKRLELWAELTRQTQGDNSLEIGLFDSEPGKGGTIHRAVLEGVIPPQPGSAPAPSVPGDEKQLIPEYYRETPFSSAWMRLSKIEREPVAAEQFYRAYAFAHPPRLDGISQADRDRYLNKLIIDDDELRSMDTTIWEVRPRQSNDRDERILATSARVSEALSPQPLLLRSGRLLHLSDLHFATKEFRRGEHNWDLIGEGSNTLQAGIAAALDTHLKGDPKIALVVITGDLTYRASEAEFYEAFRFVHALLGVLGLGPEHLVVVPGNHDIAWTAQDGEQWNHGEEVSRLDQDAMRAYRSAFYERVFRHRAASHLGMARRFVCPSGLTVEIGGLNTSALKQGPQWLAGMGRVGERAFSEVAASLGWGDGESSMALRMLALHHHVTATEDILPTDEFARGFGMASDARKTLREAARKGVQLVLHGHRHQPFLGAEQVYAELERSEKRWTLGRVAIVGGGSAGSTAVSNGENYFNLFELRPDDVELTMFRAVTNEGDRGDFRPIHTWSASLRSEEGRLILGDWGPHPPDHR